MARHGTGGTFASGAVLAVTLAFAVFAIAETRDGTGGETTRYGAVFSSSDGLMPGAPVTIGGVAVGRVASIRLDPVSMAADVAFDVRRDIVLPKGSALSVASAGLGGAGALAVDPGPGPSALPAGAVITDTTPARSLEAAVGDYIFGSGLSSSR